MRERKRERERKWEREKKERVGKRERKSRRGVQRERERVLGMLKYSQIDRQATRDAFCNRRSCNIGWSTKLTEIRRHQAHAQSSTSVRGLYMMSSSGTKSSNYPTQKHNS